MLEYLETKLSLINSMSEELKKAPATIEEVRTAFEMLPPLEQKVLDMLWGLSDKVRYTLKEVSEELGLPRDEVYDLETKAWRHFRTNININYDEKYDPIHLNR